MNLFFFFSLVQFHPQKEALLAEYDELKRRRRFAPLASCFGASA